MRGQKPHYNGPRHGGNRSDNKRKPNGDHTQYEKENAGNFAANTQIDGWNVVTKGPKKEEYKPRTREGGNHPYHRDNNNNNNQKRTDG